MAEVKDKLSSVDVLRAHYHQKRFLTGLSDPLESSGTLLLARNVGLVWSQEEPFSVQYVLTNELIYQMLPNQPRKAKKKQDNTELFKFINLFLSMSSGTNETLEKSFNVDFVSRNDETWEISLIPQIGKIRRIFTKIILRGKQLVEDVEIDEASGNKTMINFRSMTTSNPYLSSDEQLYFQN